MASDITEAEHADVERLLPMTLAIAGETGGGEEIESVAIEALIAAVKSWRSEQASNLAAYIRNAIVNRLGRRRLSKSQLARNMGVSRGTLYRMFQRAACDIKSAT